jgi:hypothetical protein
MLITVAERRLSGDHDTLRGSDEGATADTRDYEHQPKGPIRYLGVITRQQNAEST